MKILAKPTFVLLCLCLYLCAFSVAAKDYGSATVSRITSIYDGDTFRADIAGWPPIVGERMPIRLRDADTPELRAQCRMEKDMARAAKQFTVAALRGANEIRLEQIERGKYFRLVADVYVDGRNLSEMLISSGLARRYEGGSRRSWCER